MSMPRSDPMDRFVERVEVSGECWLWTGNLNEHGYGTFNPEPRLKVYAHRWLFTMVVGQVPRRLQLDHLCRVRNCVNPDHLEPVVAQVNMSRGWWATKQTCIHGHPWTPENTYLRKDNGTRQCRACRNIRARQRSKRRLSSNTHQQLDGLVPAAAQ